MYSTASSIVLLLLGILLATSLVRYSLVIILQYYIQIHVKISIRNIFISSFYDICRVQPTTMIPRLSIPFNPES